MNLGIDGDLGNLVDRRGEHVGFDQSDNQLVTIETPGPLAYHTVEFVSKEVMPHGEQWEHEGKVPREILRQMGGLGMLGLRVPEELGGLGMGMLASATFSEALAASTFAGFEVTVLVHTDMAGPHLLNSGTPDQLDRYRRCLS